MLLIEAFIINAIGLLMSKIPALLQYYYGTCYGTTISGLASYSAPCTSECHSAFFGGDLEMSMAVASKLCSIFRMISRRPSKALCVFFLGLQLIDPIF